MQPPQTFLEFFAGIGLMRLGLERAGWQCVWANDIDPKKLTMYAGYFKPNGSEFIIDDIHNITAADIPQATLATCSFPCVDLSLAGHYNGINAAGSERSGVYWQWIRLLTEMGVRRPPLVLVENVLGLITANQGADFREAIAALNQLGYTCDCFVVNALHFTPQSRPRIFIVGVQGALPLGELEFNFRLHSRSAAFCPPQLRAAMLTHSDLKWLHLDLPPLPHANHTLASIVEQLDDDDPAWWPEEKVNRLTTDRLSERHLEMVRRLMQQDGLTYRAAFNRVRKGKTYTEVRSDHFAGCLRTPMGGSGRQILIVAGQGRLRARLMTAREAARLQGAPDDYPLVDKLNDNLWGFGDAVCVPAIAWIGEHVINPLYHLLEGVPEHGG